MDFKDDSIILKLESISKRFGAVQALNNVDFVLHKGEVMALAGHNGAGKSVLCKIMGGYYHADTGNIYFEGEKVVYDKPSDAFEKGYYIVTQELTVSKELSVADNIFIGTKDFANKGLVAKKKNCEKARKLCKEFFGVDIDPQTKVGNLDIVTQRIVQVVRCLSMGAKVLVFDETTAGLAHTERDLLFSHIKELANKGIGIIFISHIISEMLNICDNVTVLRGGEVVGVHSVADLTRESLIDLIVGKKRESGNYEKNIPSEEKLLEISGLSTKNGVLQDISFDVKKGEIVGVYGLRNQGQRLLMETIFGSYKKSAGIVKYKDKEMQKCSPIESLENKLVYLPSRGEKTSFLHKTITENLTVQIQNFESKGPLTDSKKDARTAKELAEKYDIRGFSSLSCELIQLSGGNMQKVLFARALSLDPDLLILVEPTEGIDIGAKEEIKQIILSTAKQGKGIILVTSELDDIIQICNRTIVIRNSRIRSVLDATEQNRGKILESSIG